MSAPGRRRAPDFPIHRALNRLKQAEIDLSAAIELGSLTNNALVLEAHALLQELISTLSKAALIPDRG
jgi:hypothetical protein